MQLQLLCTVLEHRLICTWPDARHGLRVSRATPKRLCRPLPPGGATHLVAPSLQLRHAGTQVVDAAAPGNPLYGSGFVVTSPQPTTTVWAPVASPNLIYSDP